MLGLSRVTYCQLTSHSKISQFCMALNVQQNVSCLDVSVNLLSEMQILEALECVREDCCDFVLGESLQTTLRQIVMDASQLHDVENGPSAAVLHHNPQICVLEVGTVVLRTLE